MTAKIKINLRDATGAMVAALSVQTEKVLSASVITYKGKTYLFRTYGRFAFARATFVECGPVVALPDDTERAEV